jgi:mannan endo-1,4-beta-mannosidase
MMRSRALRALFSAAARHIASVTMTAVGLAAVAVVAAGALMATRPAAHSHDLAQARVRGSIQWHRHHPVYAPPLPTTPMSYLGVYEADAPVSYAEVHEFAQAVGYTPDLALYYSGWEEPFRIGFAEKARANGATAMVQIDPRGVSLAGIAAGRYDHYLETFADQVATFGHQVVIGFGHEPNGRWSPWGYGHVSPKTWVAAWKHVVDVFRLQGAHNVTWVWTVNIMDKRRNLIPSPSPWWPGNAYVTWVGLDGYYAKASWSFAPLFGPTIKAVRKLTLDPVLVAETGAPASVGQPAKIADLFGGINAYQLLGFVWFDANQTQHWRISSPAAFATFRRAARAYMRPAS